MIPDSILTLFGDRKAPDGTLVAENFARFFGHSKVVDETGAPLKVFHGTATDFHMFSKEKFGANYGSAAMCPGFFFAQRYEEACQAAYDAGEKNATFRTAYDEDNGESFQIPEHGSGGDVVYPVYLSIQNPLIIQANSGRSSSTFWDLSYRADFMQQVRDGGHDGIWIKSDYCTDRPYLRDGSRNHAEFERAEQVRQRDNIFIAFSPSQIKSAVGNSGLFCSNDDDFADNKEIHVHYARQRVMRAQELIAEQETMDRVNAMIRSLRPY